MSNQTNEDEADDAVARTGTVYAYSVLGTVGKRPLGRRMSRW